MSNSKFQNKYRISSARAEWHDYSGGDYFVTICTAEHEHYFGEITNGNMELTEIGRYADECIKQIGNHFADVEIPLYVIMPNHIHLIVIVDASNVETGHAPSLPQPSELTNINEKMRTISRYKGRLSMAIGSFKSTITRHATENNISFKWQTRFHDRIIRDQDEMNRIAKYIENNPYNWMKDKYY
ncbi:MAG TPA: hypothetical protein GXZ87_05195 [Bacteroidales bacterium]|nr:hypothetical protein [Bacteroidales bacterium]